LCSTHGRDEKCIQTLVGIPEGRPLGRPRRRWKDKMKVYLKEIGCVNMKWVQVQDAVTWWAFVNTVMNLRSEIFRIMTPCSVAVVYRRFGGICCFHKDERSNTTYCHNPDLGLNLHCRENLRSCGNELSGFMKGGEFLAWLSDCVLLK